MDGTYRKILLVQSLLALANATAAVFGVVYLLKAEGFPARDLVLFGLVEFLAASAVCLAIVRARLRHGVALMVAGLFVLIPSYAAFVVLRGWPLLLYVAVAWGLYIPLFFLPIYAETSARRGRRTGRARSAASSSRARSLGSWPQASVARLRSPRTACCSRSRSSS